MCEGTVGELASALVLGQRLLKARHLAVSNEFLLRPRCLLSYEHTVGLLNAADLSNANRGLSSLCAF